MFNTFFYLLNDFVINNTIIYDYPTDAFDGLIPTLAIVVGTVISLLISFFFLSYFLYFPVKKNIEAREKKIQNDLDTAAMMNSNSSKMLKNAETQLKNVKSEADKIINSAIDEAKSLNQQNQEQIKLDYDLALQKKQADIAKELEAEKDNIKQEIIETSFLVLEKFFEKELSSSANKKLIAELVDDLQTPAKPSSSTKKAS